MKVAKRLFPMALAAAFVALGLCGCERGSTPGQNLDRALDKTGEAVKDAGEAIKPK